MVEDRSLVSIAETQPYEQLVAMIERELELVSQGRFKELDQAVARRGELLATLGSDPPESARATFERARLLHERVVIDTMRARESIEQSLGRLRSVRRAARVYRPPRPHRYSTSA